MDGLFYLVEYYIINPNYTRNKMESFEQLKAYIVQG